MEMVAQDPMIVVNKKLTLLSQAVDLLKDYAMLDNGTNESDLPYTANLPQPTAEGQTLISHYDSSTSQYTWIINTGS